MGDGHPMDISVLPGRSRPLHFSFLESEFIPEGNIHSYEYTEGFKFL